jgi:hypothetical protein
LILGDESYSRFLAHDPSESPDDMYPELARKSALGDVGSSAGGEHPKFGVYRRNKHFLVKFARSSASEIDRRWRDLLWCEGKALEILRAADVVAPSARYLEVDGWGFLEVERFDRIAKRGRRGIISLFALVNEYLGGVNNWTDAAGALGAQRRFQLSRKDLKTMVWLDTFGQLIGNTDRHFGNLSFHIDEDASLRLCPVYDMLPMILAPGAAGLVDRPLKPDPPHGGNLELWPTAAKAAEAYWLAISGHGPLQGSVRRYARSAASAIKTLRDRVAC